MITCNLCQKNFERQDSYKRHLRSAGHKNIAQAKFKCNICNLSYRQAAGLSRHKRKCREKQLAEKEKENDELKKQLALMKAEAKVADAAAAAAATAAAKEIENYELKKQIAELKAAAAAIPSAAPANVHFATMPIKTYLKNYCQEATTIRDMFAKHLDENTLLMGVCETQPSSMIYVLTREIIKTLRKEKIPSLICTDVKRLHFIVRVKQDGVPMWLDHNNGAGEALDKAIAFAAHRQRMTWIRKCLAEKLMCKRNNTATHQMCMVQAEFCENEYKYTQKIKRSLAVQMNWASYKTSHLGS